MTLSGILQMIQGLAAEITPFVPFAALVGIGAKVAGVVVDTIKREGTKVVDENGKSLSAEELAQRAQDTWDRASAKAAAGSAIALDEINKARAAQGKPPLAA